MKKLTAFFAAVIAVVMACSFAACSSGGDKTGGQNVTPNDPLTGESNVLVAYFSWSASHNTQTMAEYVAEYTGGEIFRIIPETPYTTNYNDVIDVAQKEQNENARPALKEDVSAEQFSGYDVIFIGYPIWWYDAPMIIYTFLESHDFTGKTIVPFATSGGSGLNEEEKFRTITGAEVKDGLCISSFSAGDNARNRVENWVTNLGYHK
ncbi:MAG: flavodoxin [Candidatus Coproplasma sp.]